LERNSFHFILFGVVCAAALGQLLLVRIALAPRKWRHLYHRYFPPLEPLNITRGKQLDELWSARARNLALLLLVFEVALALSVSGFYHSLFERS
jgi:hypothetical protein